MFYKKPKKPDYVKIVLISLAAVAGICALAFFVYKLVTKLKEKQAAEYEEDLCEGCPLADECDGECPIEELADETAEAIPAEE